MRGTPAAPDIVVIGATGAVGRHVARLLPAGTGVRLLVRDVDKARRMGLPGELAAGDCQDRPSLERALRGADAVFVVTANPLRPADDENILAAARAGGVRHAVKLSWLAVADPAADDLIARWNRDSEELLRSSGLGWTVLRMRTPMSNALAWAPSIRGEGVVRALGGSARTACVDPRDIAAVAVRALTETGHEGRTYAMTGPAPISAREQVQELSRVLRRPIGFEELTTDQALARWRERLPEPIAQALLEAAARRSTGASAHGEGDVEAVTGRAPAAFAAWAADHAADFC
ncbi:NAD(P)H-binding protein [Streptomyces sp. AP-93]|uniref:NAD(P)H-binding protein n=1 Tax=Streptomyces sp. AP-93 TaxID=2929048 RepID=UPI001FB02219|nr:NAD(P)H-binding protein [Streptomyces sp. AP-93]MCJ0871900.1 NAD(P)H-binding protein [Streptomyces sp. AP-93]